MNDLNRNENTPVEDPYDGESAPVEAAASSSRNFLVALGILSGFLLVVTIGLVAFYLSRPRASGAVAIQATNQAVLTANAGTAMAATETRSFLMTPSITPSATVTPVPPTATRTMVVAFATITPPTSPVHQTQAAIQVGTMSAITGGIATNASPQTQTAVVGQAITLIATTSGIIPDFNMPTQTAVVERALTLVAVASSGGQAAPAQTQMAAQASTLSALTGNIPAGANPQTQTAVVGQAITLVASSGGVIPDFNIQTQTQVVGQAQTLVAYAQVLQPGSTAVANRASTALPDTGFADDAGLPGLFGMAIGLLLLIFIARRLRLSTSA